ncbi:trehalase tre37A [Flammeovirgaceae bacterium 311]|nr:trehalase tre37A [Flammeovirgaceae bacterium 311]
MIRKAYLLLLCIVLACQTSSQPEVQTYTGSEFFRPATELGELFPAVQMGHVFPDSKTFVDSRPKSNPAEILDLYKTRKNEPGFNLKAFIEEHFELPGLAAEEFQLDTQLSMEDHIVNHWTYLARQADTNESWSTLVPLPHPYVVPGGRFREIYYWDSYFTMYGLAASERMDLLESMLQNFAWLVNEVGHIPNGNRTYYLSRSQPPFFGAMVSLYQQYKGTEAALAYLPQLEKEYQFWMDGSERLQPGQSHRRVVQMPDGNMLNRYFDDLDSPRPESYPEDVETAAKQPEAQRPVVYRHLRAAAESGWDFSSRWFNDAKNLTTIQTTAIVPVDLNSLLYHLEQTISELHLAAGNQEQADDYEHRASARLEAINKWLWNVKEQAYGDYHLEKKAFTPVLSLAMVYPLYFGIATKEKAGAVAKQLQEKFLLPGGLVTTLNNTGQQWDYPNGWAPLQWLAIKGLNNYGHAKLSNDIASRWLRINRKVFQETGRMMEKYNVADTTLQGGGGEYPLQDGFGWTNGVVLAIIAGE